MIKILVADDHAIVRKGLKQIIADTIDMTVADEAGNGQEVLEKVSKNDYDVLVLDITMPGWSGLDIVKKVKTEKPDLNVLILSMHSEEQYAVRVFKAGASGYLTKDKAPDELISALQKVSEGGKYVSTTLAEKLAFDLSVSSEKPLHENLSDREFQVLCEIASGRTVKEIAENMCLSVKTISTYRSRILSKMGMKSNAELTYYSIKHGLVD